MPVSPLWTQIIESDCWNQFLSSCQVIGKMFLGHLHITFSHFQGCPISPVSLTAHQRHACLLRYLTPIKPNADFEFFRWAVDWDYIWFGIYLHLLWLSANCHKWINNTREATLHKLGLTNQAVIQHLPQKNLTTVDSGMSGSKKISDKFTMLSVTSPAALWSSF